MNKNVCVQTFNGRSLYFRTTEEDWRKLVNGTEVMSGYMVNGWKLDQQKIEKMLLRFLPGFELVAIRPYREYHEQMGLTNQPPTPDYYICYSSIDKPEA